MIQTLLIISLSIGLLSCTPNENAYDNSIPELGLGFVAKQMCSCLFVAKQNEKFCRDFVKIKQIRSELLKQIETAASDTSKQYIHTIRRQSTL